MNAPLRPLAVLGVVRVPACINAFAELKPFVPLLLTYFFPATVRTSAPHLLQCGLRFGEEENDFTTRNSSNIVDLIVKVSLVKVRSEAKLS